MNYKCFLVQAFVCVARVFVFCFSSVPLMALTELRRWVGLTSDDASAMFGEGKANEPHWGRRWGLKPTAIEARVLCMTWFLRGNDFVLS